MEWILAKSGLFVVTDASTTVRVLIWEEDFFKIILEDAHITCPRGSCRISMSQSHAMSFHSFAL